MTNKETVNRNIGLTFDFLREINNNPALLNKVPDGSIIEFIEKDFPKKEIGIMKQLKRRKYVKIKNDFEVI